MCSKKNYTVKPKTNNPTKQNLVGLFACKVIYLSMSEFLKIEDGKTYLITIICQVNYYRLSSANDKSPIKVLLLK